MELNDKIELLYKIMRLKERIIESLSRNGDESASNRCQVMAYQHEMIAIKTAIDILSDDAYAEDIKQAFIEEEEFDKYWASDGYDM